MRIIPRNMFYRRKDTLNTTGERKHRHRKRRLTREKNMYMEALYRMADTYRRIALLDLKTGISHLIKADQEEMEYMHLLGAKDSSSIAYDEWMRRSAKELVHPDYCEEFEALFSMDSLREKVSSAEPRQTMIYQCRSKVGGEYHWVQAEYVARDKNEISGEVLCYIRDISERWILAEKERRQLKEECRRGKRENQIQAEFMERSSQELRISVNTIAGMNQLALHALDMEQPDMTKHYLSLINGMTKQIIPYLSDVADLSYVQRMGIPLAYECFDIHHVAEECKEYFYYLDGDRDISFLWTGELQGLYIGDEERIKLVLFNVLENAVRYNRTGGDVRVMAEQRICSGVSDLFIIRIVDTGMGMSREQQQELFAPFSRGKHLAVDQQGAGIGLSVAKYILNAMGGGIHIDSEPNAGTEVEIRFSLPRAREMAMGRPELQHTCLQVSGAGM